MSPVNSPSTTSGQALARNALWNLLGLGAPFVVAVFAIPPLIRGLGMERFGILTLAWVMVGYFGVFDIGLGRALTKLVAEKLGRGRHADVPPLVWTGQLLMLSLGCVGTLAVWLLSPWLVHAALGIPEALQAETLNAFYALALSVPFLVSTAGWRGVLEAQQRFGIVTLIRIPMGMATFLCPLLVLPFSTSLFPIMIALVVARVVAWAVHLAACFHVMPALRHSELRGAMVRPLMHFGGWMTVTNIVSPVMMYFDRFLISALISVAAVTYYVTPFEVVTKLLVVPAAVVGVLFPAFSTVFAQERQRAAVLYYRGIKYIFLSMFPVVLLVVTFSPEFLEIWLGREFSENSARVLQIIAIGVLVNAVANVPFALLQGTGRPDVTGKLNLIELPCYLIAAWWLVRAYGIDGAAIAWFLRMTIDATVLAVISEKFLSPAPSGRGGMLSLVVLMLAMGVGVAALPITIKIGVFSIFCVAYTWMTWILLSAVEERALLNRGILIFRHAFRFK